MKNAFNYAFTVYKPEMTDEPINIVYPSNETFDFAKKESHYLNLGYTVTYVKYNKVLTSAK